MASFSPLFVSQPAQGVRSFLGGCQHVKLFVLYSTDVRCGCKHPFKVKMALGSTVMGLVNRTAERGCFRAMGGGIESKVPIFVGPSAHGFSGSFLSAMQLVNNSWDGAGCHSRAKTRFAT